MFCYKCGTVIKEDALFCHKCGTKAIKDDNISEKKDNNSSINKSKDAYRRDNELKKSESASDVQYFDYSDDEVEYFNSVHTQSENNNTSSSYNNKSGEEESLLDVSSDKGRTILAVGGISLLGIGLGEWTKIEAVKMICIVVLIFTVITYIAYLIKSGNDKERKLFKKISGKVIAFFVVVTLIAIVYVYFFYINPSIITNIIRPGAGVRDAYLTQYSETVTIDKAFSNYFDNEKWDTYDKDGYSYVTFKGTCTYLGEKADICITFKITGENFVADGLDINGKRQNEILLLGLLSNVYDGYDESSTNK